MADAACREGNKREDKPEDLMQTTSNTTDQNSASIDFFLKNLTTNSKKHQIKIKLNPKTRISADKIRDF